MCFPRGHVKNVGESDILPYFIRKLLLGADSCAGKQGNTSHNQPQSFT